MSGHRTIFDFGWTLTDRDGVFDLTALLLSSEVEAHLARHILRPERRWAISSLFNTPLVLTNSVQ